MTETEIEIKRLKQQAAELTDRYIRQYRQIKRKINELRKSKGGK